MNNYINDFWKWLGLTPEEYASGTVEFSKFEDDYPYFQNLIDKARNIIINSDFTNSSIDDLLTILAIDNEAEEILDCMVDDLPNEYLIKVIEKGIEHPQPNARWQIAELIYRRKPINYKGYLERLSSDSNKYVVKRAKNLISYLGK